MAITPGEVIGVEEMLDYQDGSVVSRQIVKDNGGTVTVFAFDEGEGMSAHTTPHVALLMLLDGSATVEIGGEARTVKEGEMVLLPANVPHALKAPERFKMLLTMIRS
jgi:quercetin dioxygenase-like cupin family protein